MDNVIRLLDFVSCLFMTSCLLDTIVLVSCYEHAMNERRIVDEEIIIRSDDALISPVFDDVATLIRLSNCTSGEFSADLA
jgi:hypothetical protein